MHYFSQLSGGFSDKSGMHYTKLLFIFLFSTSYITCLADQFERFTENGKVGLKNTTTNTIAIPASYEALGWSDKSFSVVNGVTGALQNEQWALVDTEGHRVTDPVFSALLPSFAGNFIASKRQNNSIVAAFGLIDARGKNLIPFNYSTIAPHSAGLIVSQKNGNRYESGFLNEKGAILIPIEYKRVESLNTEHLAIGNFKEQYAIYETSGKALTDFQYEYVTPFKNSYYIIGQYNHKGVLNNKMEMIVPPLYKALEFRENEVMAYPYTEWDYFESASYQATLYFDDVSLLDSNTFATLADGKTGISNIQSEYRLFLPDEELVESNKEILLTKDKNSDRFKVYNSNGKHLFRDSFEDVQLFDHVFFGKINQADGHSWAVYNFAGKKLNLFNYQSFTKRSELHFEARRNNKIGLISADGKEASPFLYDALSEYKNGRAIAYYNGSYGAINEHGIWIMTPYYDSLALMENQIYFKQGSEYGLADWYGKIVYRSQEKFQAAAKAAIHINEDSSYSLLSLNGELLLEHQYDSIESLNEDLLLLKRDNQRFLYRPSDAFDARLDPMIDSLGRPNNGYMAVRKDGQWGFINTSGGLVIANRYEEVSSFAEGLFGVKLIGKWGYVNEREELIIQPNYDQIERFQNGLAVVMNAGKYGIINQQSEAIVKIDYDNIERLGNLFLLYTQGMIGLADETGTIIKNPSYDSIKALKNGYFLVERNERYGVIDESGRDILPTNYEIIKQSGDLFLGSRVGSSRVFKLK